MHLKFLGSRLYGRDFQVTIINYFTPTLPLAHPEKSSRIEDLGLEF